MGRLCGQTDIMKRVAFNFYRMMLISSLLLLIATVMLWVRSSRVCDIIAWYRCPLDHSFSRRERISSFDGEVRVNCFTMEGGTRQLEDERHFQYWTENKGDLPRFDDALEQALRPRAPQLEFLGFVILPEQRWANAPGAAGHMAAGSLAFPLWFPCLVFALLPAHYFLRVRRRRRVASRRARGCCVFCGYDLRASAGRCPECGRDVAGDDERNHGLH